MKSVLVALAIIPTVISAQSVDAAALSPDAHARRVVSACRGSGNVTHREKSNQLAANGSAFVQGLVVDAAGRGLGSGVVTLSPAVFVSSRQVGSATGLDGHYAFSIPVEHQSSRARVTLLARRIGYRALSKKVKLKAGDSLTIRFSLCADARQLETAHKAGALPAVASKAISTRQTFAKSRPCRASARVSSKKKSKAHAAKGSAVVQGVLRDTARSHLSSGTVYVSGLKVSTQSGASGHYALTVPIPPGDSALHVSVVARRIGYEPLSKQLELKAGDSVTVDFTFCPATGIYEFALKA